MPVILVSLPLLVFLGLVVNFLARLLEDPGRGEAWRTAFVLSAVACGAAVTVSAELLSLFRALTQTGLALTWGILLAAVATVAWRSGALSRVLAWLRDRLWRPHFLEAFLALGVAILALVIGVVAWVSPPNTTDSLLYHMSRVVHWAQNASLAHYPTTYEHQLWFPPWAETAILTLRLLWGDDQPAGLIQWASMAGALVVVPGIAGLLGADRRGRLVAVLFAFGLPMGILQASSTQNDYASAFWLVCLAYLILLTLRSPRRRWHGLGLGMALGLGLLTKATFYLFALPFVIWYGIAVWRQSGLGTILRSVLLVVGAAAVLNLGFWARNWVTYGGPLGPGTLVQGHLRLPSILGIPAAWGAHLLTHFATPSEPANRAIEASFLRLTSALRAPMTDFHLTWAWNHEDLAGSPIHVVIALLAVLASVGWLRARRDPTAAGYVAAATVASALAGALVTWNPYVPRLHLPLLVLGAPLVGAVAGRWLRPGWIAALCVGLLLISTPWVLLNQTRPVIGWRPRTAIVSVFEASEENILFANWLPLRDDFVGAVDAVQATGCRQIGMQIDSHDLEYPFWLLLRAPQSGMRLEHIDPPSHLARYVDPAFRPCAILCMVCGGRARLHGLERSGTFGPIALYLGSTYAPGEDD